VLHTTTLSTPWTQSLRLLTSATTTTSTTPVSCSSTLQPTPQLTLLRKVSTPSSRTHPVWMLSVSTPAPLLKSSDLKLPTVSLLVSFSWTTWTGSPTRMPMRRSLPCTRSWPRVVAHTGDLPESTHGTTPCLRRRASRLLLARSVMRRLHTLTVST
ncbi:hypothetical protein HDU99_008280, partial [Rhizoclosmatium hyalinum]